MLQKQVWIKYSQYCTRKDYFCTLAFKCGSLWHNQPTLTKKFCLINQRVKKCEWHHVFHRAGLDTCSSCTLTFAKCFFTRSTLQSHTDYSQEHRSAMTKRQSLVHLHHACHGFFNKTRTLPISKMKWLLSWLSIHWPWNSQVTKQHHST